jgi:hypothetical protein
VPTATLVPTATVEALHASPSQGWVTVPVLSFAENIAFAVSDPLTGYVCGNTQIETGSNASNTLAVSVTHDGGRTWSAPTLTSAHGVGCDLSINPSNPTDLVMDAWSCYPLCGQAPPRPYRSHDGGMTWTALTLDPTQWPATSETNWFVSPAVWIGSTAYFAVETLGEVRSIPRPPHAFVTNTSGSLLTAPNDAMYSVVTDPNAIPRSIWAHGSMLGVELTSDVNYANNYFVKSTDGGASWQTFTPAGADRYLNANDGVIGADNSDYVESSDGGLTWRQLPAPPMGNLAVTGQGPFDTADGSVLVAGAQYDVWLLNPDASTWQNVAPLKTGGYLTAQQILDFSTDASGHPVIAWGQAARSSLNGVAQPAGIAYRALG